MTELKQIQKYIKENLPKSVKIRYISNIKKYAERKIGNLINKNLDYNAFFVIYNNEKQEIWIQKNLIDLEKCRVLLHEFCHLITWKNEYSSRLKYLSEYAAEKKLRQLCKENNWKNTLYLSDLWLKENTTCVEKMYEYCSKRIIREEKI